jgi:hypothetical protein
MSNPIFTADDYVNFHFSGDSDGYGFHLFAFDGDRWLLWDSGNVMYTAGDVSDCLACGYSAVCIVDGRNDPILYNIATLSLV